MTDDLPPRETPLEALANMLGDEIAAALARRSRTQRSIPKRRTLSSLLAGGNVTLRTIADVAAVLACRVEIRLVDVDSGAIDGSTPADAITLNT